MIVKFLRFRVLANILAGLNTILIEKFEPPILTKVCCLMQSTASNVPCGRDAQGLGINAALIRLLEELARKLYKFTTIY